MKTHSCSACATAISATNKSGKCRSCAMKARHADPQWRERHYAAVRASCSTPESRAKKSAAAAKVWGDPAMRAKMSAAKLRALSDPVKRARVVKAAAENLRNWHATTDRDWSSWWQSKLAERASAQAVEQAAADAAEAERTRLAAMTPFERQLERVRNGAKLIEVRPLRRADPDFTLGGVATGML